MANTNAKVVNIEEFETIPEEENEVNSEGFNANSLVAGLVGGVLAYALVGGVKKLSGVVVTRWKARKQAKLLASNGTDDDEAEYFDEDDSE